MMLAILFAKVIKKHQKSNHKEKIVENLGELEGMKISPSIRLAAYQGVRHLSKP